MATRWDHGILCFEVSRILAADQVKHACRTIGGLQQWRVGMEILADFLGGLFSRGENTKTELLVGCSNGGCLAVPLLKALSRDRTFCRVKAQVLIMLVRPDDDSVCALLPSWRRRFLEPFQSLGVDISALC